MSAQTKARHIDAMRVAVGMDLLASLFLPAEAAVFVSGATNQVWLWFTR